VCVCVCFSGCFRFDLAQALVNGGDSAGAVEHLLAIVSMDRTWNDGAARTMLLNVFESLGPAHPIVATGRKKLAKLLFS
jgi:putative thioredoxin